MDLVEELDVELDVVDVGLITFANDATYVAAKQQADHVPLLHLINYQQCCSIIIILTEQQ